MVPSKEKRAQQRPLRFVIRYGLMDLDTHLGHGAAQVVRREGFLQEQFRAEEPVARLRLSAIFGLVTVLAGVLVLKLVLPIGSTDR